MEPGIPPGGVSKLDALSDLQKQDFTLLMQDAGRIEAASLFLNRRLKDPFTSADPNPKIMALSNRLQATGCVVNLLNRQDPVDPQTADSGMSLDGPNCVASANIEVLSSRSGKLVNISLTQKTAMKPGPDQALNDVMDQEVTGSGTITESESGGTSQREGHFRAIGHISSASRGTISITRTVESKLVIANNSTNSTNSTKARIDIADYFVLRDHKVLLQQIAIQDGDQNSGRRYFINGTQISDVEYSSYLSTWSSAAQFANKF